MSGPSGPSAGAPGRRRSWLAVGVAVVTLTMLAVLAGTLRGLGDITDEFSSRRILGAQMANSQRDLMLFHRSVLRLGLTDLYGAPPGQDLADAHLRRDLALHQLTTTRAQFELGDPRRARIDRLVRGLEGIDLDALAARAGPGRVALVAGADARMERLERELKALNDSEDLTFQEVTAAALAAKVGAQRYLGVLVVLTLALAGAWGWQHRRRAQIDLAAAHDALTASEARFRSLVQHSSDLTLLVNEGGEIVWASPAAQVLTGRPPATLEGSRLRTIVHLEDRGGVRNAVTRLLNEPDRPTTVSFRIVHADGTLRHVDAVGTNLVGDIAVGAVVLNVRDVTEHHRLQSELATLAFHDPLTGLPNRALLRDRLRQAAAGRRRSSSALLLVDLDDFKAVNDGLGHEHGDSLLVAIAERLREAVRPGDLVARLGGDEFVVFAEDIGGAEGAARLAERLLDVLGEPVTVGAESLPGGGSVGVRLAGGPGFDPDDLLRDADLAMYSAKAAGKGRWAIYRPEMHEEAAGRLSLRAELREAVGSQLTLHYQPVVAAESGRITGFEALVRWVHPARGLLGPGEFIPQAEESGLIVPLGEWVLDEACAAARRLQVAAGRDDLTMSVNLSVRQLESPSIVATVVGALARSGLAADRLVLEVTESLLVSEASALLGRLRQIRDLGVRVAVDDFGTGFSSLAYLERLPLDALKIDRSFTESLSASAGRAVLVETIVRLGSALGLETVAEGVETLEQFAALRALGCTHVQGFLVSRPVPEDAAAHLLAARAMPLGPTLAGRHPTRDAQEWEDSPARVFGKGRRLWATPCSGTRPASPAGGAPSAPAS